MEFSEARFHELPTLTLAPCRRKPARGRLRQNRFKSRVAQAVIQIENKKPREEANGDKSRVEAPERLMIEIERLAIRCTGIGSSDRYPSTDSGSLPKSTIHL